MNIYVNDSCLRQMFARFTNEISSKSSPRYVFACSNDFVSHFFVMLHKHRTRYTLEALLYFFIVGILLVEQYSAVANKMSCKRARPVNAIRRIEVRYYANTWAVRILGGVSEAKRVAKSAGQNFHKKVGNQSTLLK